MKIWRRPSPPVPTKDNGGDLGYFKRGVLAKELEDKVFPLKAGEYTEPIRTKQGFVVIKVAEHQEAGVPPMSQVENQIQEALYMEKLEPALRAYLTKLREDAFIDIKPGYVDTAASPNETKPVYTTATNEHAKVKAEEEEKVSGCSNAQRRSHRAPFRLAVSSRLSTPFHNFDLIRTASQQRVLRFGG